MTERMCLLVPVCGCVCVCVAFSPGFLALKRAWMRSRRGFCDSLIPRSQIIQSHTSSPPSCLCLMNLKYLSLSTWKIIDFTVRLAFFAMHVCECAWSCL